jgi:hypothetical protein
MIDDIVIVVAAGKRLQVANDSILSSNNTAIKF